VAAAVEAYGLTVLEGHGLWGYWVSIQ